MVDNLEREVGVLRDFAANARRNASRAVAAASIGTVAAGCSWDAPNSEEGRKAAEAGKGVFYRGDIPQTLPELPNVQEYSLVWTKDGCVIELAEDRTVEKKYLFKNPWFAPHIPLLDLEAGAGHLDWLRKDKENPRTIIRMELPKCNEEDNPLKNGREFEYEGRGVVGETKRTKINPSTSIEAGATGHNFLPDSVRAGYQGKFERAASTVLREWHGQQARLLYRSNRR